MSHSQNEIGPLGPVVGYHLRRAFGAFAADFTAVMEGTGMRQVLVGILSVVTGNPGINQGAVGRVLGIKRANMVALINELVDAGLIVRDVDPADRRAFSLRITPAGETMLAQCLDRIEAHEARMLAEFTSEERTLLLDLLARIERKDGAER